MKLKDLIAQYGEYEVDSKCVVGECEIERIVIDLTKPKPKSVWELNNKDEHYSVTECGFIKHFDASDFIGYKRDIGNVFLTEEEANREVERRKVEALLLKHGGRRWFKRDSYNYYMWVNTWDSLVIHSSGVRVQGLIYFDSEEQAQKAVQEIGEDCIKESLFEVR